MIQSFPHEVKFNTKVELGSLYLWLLRNQLKGNFTPTVKGSRVDYHFDVENSGRSQMIEPVYVFRFTDLSTALLFKLCGDAQ